MCYTNAMALCSTQAHGPFLSFPKDPVHPLSNPVETLSAFCITTARFRPEAVTPPKYEWYEMVQNETGCEEKPSSDLNAARVTPDPLQTMSPGRLDGVHPDA